MLSVVGSSPVKGPVSKRKLSANVQVVGNSVDSHSLPSKSGMPVGSSPSKVRNTKRDRAVVLKPPAFVAPGPDLDIRCVDSVCFFSVSRIVLRFVLAYM